MANVPKMRMLLPFAAFCLAAVVVDSVSGAFTVGSHYVTKYYSQREVRYYRRCWSCGWWWRRHTCCCTRSYYVSVRKSYRACANGYRGTYCNIPICWPSCRGRGVCVAVNKCDCPTTSTGSYCQIRKCNWAKDCYPGICNSANTNCECSSEFTGYNCQEMKEGPIFQHCAASLIDRRNGRNDVFPVNCSYYGDELKIYTSMRDFSHIALEWSPTYRKLEDLPPYPRDGYMRTFRVGLINARAEAVLKDTGGSTAKTIAVSCTSPANWKNPQETIQCRYVREFREGVKHNQTLTFIMYGTTGGYKDVRNQDTAGSYELRRMYGHEGSIKAYVVFDLNAPFHCTEGRPGFPCREQGVRPVLVNEEITKKPDMDVAFPGWNDTDSGLRGFTYSVYRLALTPEGILQNLSTPVVSGGYDLFTDQFSSKFRLPAPGMYAIVAGVHDFANNTRYTRGLVLYSGKNDTIQKTDVPLSVEPGAGNRTVDGAFWISDLSDPVRLTWAHHFANRFLAKNGYGRRVAPLPVAFLDSNGNLSSSGVTNIDGVSQFSYSVVHRLQIPKSRRRRQLTPPDSWTAVDPVQGTITLDALSPRHSGNSYTIHMKVGDMAGNVMTDYIYIRVADKPPNVKNISANFQKRVTREEEGFFSSVDVSASDFRGGLHFIGFTLYDVLDPASPRQINAGTQLINKTKQDPNSCQSEGKCTCTNEAECYDNPLKLYINNCWLVDYMSVPIRIDISVHNRARLSTNITYQIDDVTGISGIGEYPAAKGLRLKKAYGYVVVLTWYLPVSCYEIRLLRLKLTGPSKQNSILSANEREVELKDLVPYADYTARLSITYQGNRESEAIELNFNTGEPPTSASSGCGLGCIVGITIGLLILVGIVIIVVLVVIRLRQHKTPLPERFMDPVNRMSRHFGHPGWEKGYTEEAPPSYRETVQKKSEAPQNRENSMSMNVAYSSNPKLGDFEEDIYTYGEMQTDSKAKWKHSDDRVTVGKTLSKGRFAEIKEGTLKQSDGTRKVAVKILLDKSADNILLMKAKMHFLATVVPNHNNIVNFVGAVTEGPIILLELCDQSLAAWLKKIDVVTDKIEDEMIDFCTDIARGMSHLHENGILHRRLGARNVLLKHVPEMFRVVAKITGFGPMSAEGRGNTDSDKERIPIKWMALEQLGIEKGENRPYTEATDVWSFGVTIWEIYSKGALPFSKVRSTEVRSLLEAGTRLEQPEYASDELYNTIMMPCWNRSPDQRPTFQQLTNDLVSMFNASGGGDMYYDDAPKSAGLELYDGTLNDR